MEDGGDAHWEWPKECLGYKLPVVIETFDELGMLEAIINGCMVGARGWKGGLLAKPWKIMTTPKVMAKRMNLRCQGNHARAVHGIPDRSRLSLLSKADGRPGGECDA